MTKDLVTVSRDEYNQLLKCRDVLESVEYDLYYREAKRISSLVKKAKMKVYSEEEVIGDYETR